MRLSLPILVFAFVWPFAASAEKLPGPVVDAKWFKDHVSHVVLIDVRNDLDSWTKAPEYEKDEKTGEQKLSATGGHIDGALPLLFKKVRVDKTVDGKKIEKMLPDRAYVQDLMQATGAAKGKPIVITSPGEAADEIEAAARVYWTLKLYGADDIALLDGGNAAWIAAGLPVSTEKKDVARGDWEAKAERKEMVAELADVEQAIKDKVQIVDARPLPQYLGVSFKKPAVTVGGHLVGALNVPTDVRVRSSGIAQMFLKPDEYRAVLKAQGVQEQVPTVTYCNTGHMASGMWFIQSEILGAKNVRLYDGSMHEWTTLGKPVVGLGG
ncbi:MAG: sulfurtransferase [Panacagrimonas sp.]